MEKYTPHYDLAVIKADVRRLGARAFTRAAKEAGKQLDLDISEMQAVVFKLQNRMLYKSMTTYADHRVWQDVYRPTTPIGVVYLKLTVIDDLLIVSFKEL